MHRRIALYRIRPSWLSPHQVPLRRGRQRELRERTEDNCRGCSVNMAFSAHSECLKRLSSALTGAGSPPSRCRNVRAHRLTLCSQSSSCARATGRGSAMSLVVNSKKAWPILAGSPMPILATSGRLTEKSLYGSLAFGRQRLKSFCQNSRIQRRSHFAVACHGSHFLSRSPYAGRRSICRLLATQ